MRVSFNDQQLHRPSMQPHFMRTRYRPSACIALDVGGPHPPSARLTSYRPYLTPVTLCVIIPTDQHT
jgi:hypothetical protein